jgi:hypothetical protein
LPVPGLDIEGYPLLIDIVGQPIKAIIRVRDISIEGTELSGWVALRWLDLYHLSTEVSQDTTAERRPFSSVRSRPWYPPSSDSAVCCRFIGPFPLLKRCSQHLIIPYLAWSAFQKDGLTIIILAMYAYLGDKHDGCGGPNEALYGILLYGYCWGYNEDRVIFLLKGWEMAGSSWR